MVIDTNTWIVVVNKYLLILLLLFSSSAHAGKWTDFFLGMASSMIVHELSHEVVARAYGEQLQWNGMAWSCPQCSPESIQPIAIAGLTANIVSSEILLRKNQTPYVRGWLSMNIISQVQYSFGENGDLSNFPSNQKDTISALSTIHAASVSQRSKIIYVTHNGIFFKIFID